MKKSEIVGLVTGLVLAIPVSTVVVELTELINEKINEQYDELDDHKVSKKLIEAGTFITVGSIGLMAIDQLTDLAEGCTEFIEEVLKEI